MSGVLGSLGEDLVKSVGCAFGLVYDKSVASSLVKNDYKPVLLENYSSDFIRRIILIIEFVAYGRSFCFRAFEKKQQEHETNLHL